MTQVQGVQPNYDENIPWWACDAMYETMTETVILVHFTG